MEFAGGRYKLGVRIGQGGTATIYRAVDTLLGVERAVKVLRLDGSTTTRQRRRFLLEARTMARLAHPSIVRVYDLGLDGDVHYVVMDLVRGGSLAERIERDGALRLRSALQIGVDILGALQVAHEAGVVHRDVKPHNILLTREDHAMLADFGIARRIDSDARATQPGALLGTLAFMAPEQRVDARTAGPPADVYGLGASIYHALTTESPLDVSLVNESAERWQLVDARVRPALRKAMQHDPDRRFRTADDFAEAIAEVLDRLEPEPIPPSTEPTASPDAGRDAPTLWGHLTQTDEASHFELRELYRRELPRRILALEAALDLEGPGVDASLERVLEQLRRSASATGLEAVSAAVAAVENAHETEPRTRALQALLAVVRSSAYGPTDDVGSPILVIEGDPATRALLQQVCAGTGREVLAAATAEEAAAVLKGTAVSVIVVDVRLPDGDGRELLLSLREEPATARVPSIVVSERSTAPVRTECLALGAEAFLEKPFDQAVLLAAVSRALRPRSFGQQTWEVDEARDREQFRAALLLARERHVGDGEDFCLGMLAWREYDPTADGPDPDEEVRRGVAALQEALPTGCTVARWEGGLYLVLIRQHDLAGAELALNLAFDVLANPESEGAVMTVAAGLVEPRRASVGAAMHLVDRMTRLAVGAGPFQVVAAACPQPRSRRVVLGEVDATTAEILRRLIGQEGHDVHGCTSQDDVIGDLLAAPTSVVVVDVDQEAYRGYDLIEAIRRDKRLRRVRILALTSKSSHSAALAFELGADDCARKTAQPRELRGRLRRVLRD